jgi:uncharacterized protein (DUF433 family)
MSTVSTYPHIVSEPGTSAHMASHPRTRVAMIAMDYLVRGLAPEEMVRHYPYLTLAEVHAAMGYYHDHREEIDSEIKAEMQQLRQISDTNQRSNVWLKLKAQGTI